MIQDNVSVTQYERIIEFNEEKQYQIRLCINEFRGIEYIHLRRYYLDFFEEWKPSSEGISMPLSLENTRELFEGLVEILSLAESKSILEDHFSDTLNLLYQN